MAHGHVCGSSAVHTQLLYPRLRQDDGLVFDAFCGDGSVVCFASAEQMETLDLQ
ncbi:unknown [Acetobacter sp. CAG:977]|nr:unknown [Acetobacter sp. CAG:977]